ncbi:DUF779 domain-containing protein [Halostreptopolyspora alba]|uniref:DUF779 domain-containing protein n=1 Tax=Halostreptopolyspora alba TaxID=2487137 RepID=A0A3N0E8Q5_9ACTN|nr:DUF779 domain-containing protein [Nocardiopsaceae bacterium YIM 96095]
MGEGSAAAPRVQVTAQAAAVLRELREQYGPLMFHQSGGCCDGSSPMCYRDGEFRLGDSDVRLGELEAGTPEPVTVWMSRSQFAAWSHTRLTIDVVPGRGGGFSLEAPTGNRFIIRSDLMNEDSPQQR